MAVTWVRRLIVVLLLLTKADAGVPTRSVMEEIVAKQLALFRDSFAPVVAAPPAAAAPPPPAPVAVPLFVVNGRMCRAPGDFTFPSGSIFFFFVLSDCDVSEREIQVTAERMFSLYCLGDVEKKIGPFRSFQRNDMPNKTTKKRVSDMHGLMGRLEKKLKNDGEWIDNPTVAQVNSMYELAKVVLELDEETPTGRKRRRGQLVWNTHLDLIRKSEKRREAAASSDDDDD